MITLQFPIRLIRANQLWTAIIPQDPSLSMAGDAGSVDGLPAV
jgi:hypothetical protein